MDISACQSLHHLKNDLCSLAVVTVKTTLAVMSFTVDTITEVSELRLTGGFGFSLFDFRTSPSIFLFHYR